MLRRTALGSLAVAALASPLAAGVTPAEATPTWVHNSSISKTGALPTDATVAVADDGSAVAAWVRTIGQDERVQVASAYDGVWGQVSTVSDAGKDASDPSVAINAHGDAVVTWLQPDLSDDLRLAASRRLTSTTWDGRALVSPQDEGVQGAASIGVDGDGDLVAAYVAVGGANVKKVRVTTWQADGDPATAIASGAYDAYAPSVAVNDDGAALISFHDSLGAGPDSAIRASRIAAGATYLQPAVEVSAPGVHGLASDAVITDAGSGQVAFTGEWLGEMRVQTVKVQPEGNPGSASFASSPGTGAANPSLDVNADGDALLAWQTTNGELGIDYATSYEGSDWTTAELKVDVFSPSSPTAMISDSGVTMIAYGGSGRLLAAYRTRSLLPFTYYDSGDQDFKSGSAVAGMDDQGNALLAGVLPDELVGAFLDVAGPAIQSSAPATALGASYELTWSGLDRLSAVQDSEVVVQKAPWNGTFGDPKQLANHTDELSLKVGLAPGRTACASVQMRDTVGNLSVWSKRCTTAPVDDRTLKATTGFIKEKGKGHYRGTVIATVDKGAKLTLPGAKARRIALVVAKSANAGKVRVTFAGQDLGVFNLQGSGKKKVVPVKTFGSVKSGKLVVTVVSPDGKRVAIDGVVIAK